MSHDEIGQEIESNLEIPIVCLPDAFTPEQRERYEEIREQMHATVQDVEELANGFALHFGPKSEVAPALLEFILLERRCCPFLHFELAFEPGNGPLWLRLTGGEGVKEFLQAEFSLV